MKERVSLQELIALNNTPKAKALIVKYGYKPAKNYNDLTYKLVRFTKDFRDEALKELSNIHPHKDLILNYHCKPETDKLELIKKDKKENFEGNWGDECQCRECRRKRMIGLNDFMNFEGTDTPNNNQNNPANTQLATLFPIIAISGIVAIGMYIAFASKN